MEVTNKQVRVTIEGESESATKINLHAGRFNMVIDEPAQMGGTDEGPTPVQVLLMSLAGCLSITGHAVAHQRGLKLNEMKIKIEGAMNPCAFMGTSFEERAGFQEINVSIDADFDGASQEEQEAWLDETEKRCPVTDNIKDSTKIKLTPKY
jgi:uncharacterized OsmC-like protein